MMSRDAPAGRMGVANRVFRLVLMGALTIVAAPVFAQGTTPSAQAETDRLLKGAIDMHFHVDPPDPARTAPRAGIAEVRTAMARGLRGLVLKDHNEPTAPLAYHLRREMPGFEVFGGVVMNLANGGINPDMVEFMATRIKGRPGRMVWMPAGDGEAEVRASNQPVRRFVSVIGKDGQLLPGVKRILALAAKYGLVLASGHIPASQALLLFAEGKRAGVRHMVATHAMDVSSRMTLPQMRQAAALGAIIEFDFRNILSEQGIRADAIRAVGPEHCLISEYWNDNATLEYGAAVPTYAWISQMRARGFTDRELDIMFKDNPARLLDLPVLK